MAADVDPERGAMAAGTPAALTGWLGGPLLIWLLLVAWALLLLLVRG